MTPRSRILGALAELPPARTHDVAVERDLEAKMADGAVLLADHEVPHDPDHPSAVVLPSAPSRSRDPGRQAVAASIQRRTSTANDRGVPAGTVST